jgi:hypothetical protein
MEEYPSNSRAKKEAEQARPKLTKVTTQGVRVKKKTFGDSLKYGVWGKYVKPALIFAGVSIILPAIKDMAEDAVTGMIRGAFNGGQYDRSSRSKGSTSFTNYSKYSGEKKEEKRVLSDRARSAHDFSELILDSRAECEYILETLEDLVDRYGHAKVSDMYSLAGISGSFTDDKWGWFDLSTAGVRRHQGGYLLQMPRTQPID